MYRLWTINYNPMIQWVLWKINRISVDLVVFKRNYSWRGCGVKVVLVQVRGKKRGGGTCTMCSHWRFKMYVLITCCHLYPRFTVFVWKNVQFDWDKPFYVRNYRSASLFHGAGCYFRKWLQKTIYCNLPLTCSFEQQKTIFPIVVYEISSCLSEYVSVFLFNFF